MEAGGYRPAGSPPVTAAGLLMHATFGTEAGFVRVSGRRRRGDGVHATGQSPAGGMVAVVAGAARRLGATARCSRPAAIAAELHLPELPPR